MRRFTKVEYVFGDIRDMIGLLGHQCCCDVSDAEGLASSLFGRFPHADSYWKRRDGGYAEHPVCGDRMELSVRREGDVVRAVRWRASGCPASMALAALCAEVLIDVPVAQLEQVLRAGVAARGGLQRHEQHAERMALRALREALQG